MFEKPTRNHGSIILERCGAVIALFGVFAFNNLQEYGWDIFYPSFYKMLWHSAIYEGNRALLILGLATAFLLWYLYISVRYWRLTTFYVDGTDFVYERKTMFRAASRLPIGNIAVVNVERNIFERLIGTGKVKIDLNSSRTASSTDFKFVLKKDEAQALKETLMTIKQSLGREVQIETQEAAEPEEPRTLVAQFTVAQALRHKLLSMQVIQSAVTLTVLFILPQLRLSGDYDMSKLWFLLLIAVLGWLGSVVKGTLDLGDYTVERDSRMVYISCGVLNKKHYVFELEKINAVIINQPLLARFFGMASIDLAVVGLGNEKNETTHLCLITEKDQIEAILRSCVPDFDCTGEVHRCHPINLLYTILRAFLLGAATLLLSGVYRNAYILAILVFAAALCGAVAEYLLQDFASDDSVLRCTSGMFNKRTGIFKYGDVQNMVVRTNPIYRKWGLGKLNFSILGATSVRNHKTGLFAMQVFDNASAQMILHEDNVLKGKYGKKE